MSLIDLLNSDGTVIAVIGATDQPGKYGGIVYRTLRNRHYKAVAVNPGRSTVAGDPCFPSVSSMTEKPHLVCLVVPSTVGIGVVADCLRQGLRSFWVQPGAESPALTALFAAQDADYVVKDCIMVRARRRRGGKS